MLNLIAICNLLHLGQRADWLRAGLAVSDQRRVDLSGVHPYAGRDRGTCEDVCNPVAVNTP
jgi:hypothetical protein